MRIYKEFYPNWVLAGLISRGTYMNSNHRRKCAWKKVWM